MGIEPATFLVYAEKYITKKTQKIKLRRTLNANPINIPQKISSR